MLLKPLKNSICPAFVNVVRRVGILEGKFVNLNITQWSRRLFKEIYKNI